MAVIQHSNGITEDCKADGLVFTDEELLTLFNDYAKIKTLRLKEIPNTWCIWGQNDMDDPIEYNRIATGITKEEIYSPIVILHDGELNPHWDMNDTILHTYDEFKEEVLLFIDEVAKDILEEDMTDGSLNDQDSLFLETLGPTADKKLLLEFNHNKQDKTFFEDKNIKQFLSKVIEYWEQYFYENINISDNNCVIYADSKIVIIVQDEYTLSFMDMIIEHNLSKEIYEICGVVTKYETAWRKYIKNNKQVNLLNARNPQDKE